MNPTPDESSQDEATPASALISQNSQWSWIWLIPLLAAMIGAWLIYQGMQNASTEIIISFKTANGIKANKTQLIHKGLAIGRVNKLALNPKTEQIDVSVAIKPQARHLLTTGTRFWLVKAEIGLGGISGLDTLLSGNHIALDPAEGKPNYAFTALDGPPAIDTTTPGLHLQLHTDELSSITIGSPISYRKMNVGTVSNFHLDEDKQGVTVNAFIEPEFSHLVRGNSRFWNASGIHVQAGLAGLDVQIESLSSIIRGGIAFYTPENEAIVEPAQNQQRFEIHPNFSEAEAGVMIEIEFASAQGLKPKQTKIVYNGIPIGLIRSLEIMDDLQGVRAIAYIDPRAEPALVDSARFWMVKAQLDLKGISALETLISGNYIAVDIPNVRHVDELSALPSRRKFKALNEAPIRLDTEQGLNLVLKSTKLGSISRGSPLTFQQVKVGHVLDFSLSKKRREVLIHVNIEEPYKHLVNRSSRFWNVSGVSVSGGLSGLKIETESLSSLLAGGIAFDTPSTKSKPGQNKQSFTLFEDFQQAHQAKLKIDIRFNNAQGLAIGTPLKLQGIQIGKIEKLSLDKGLKGVIVQAGLEEHAHVLAQQGALFWVVKAQLGLSKTANLETLVAGQYIQAQPPLEPGPEQLSFMGLEKPPHRIEGKQGLKLILQSKALDSIKQGSPIYYRDIRVGEVSGFELSQLSDGVDIFINIAAEYENLIHQNTRFWNSSGVEVNFGLFKGASIRTDSLESLLAGGISLATPNNNEMGAAAKAGTHFILHRKPQEQWLHWSPQIKR